MKLPAKTTRAGAIRSFLLVISAIVFLAYATESVTKDLPSLSLAHSDDRGKDLRGADFRNTDLTMADFSHTDLRGADFTGADLDRINLDGADLRGVVGLKEAKLSPGISARNANFSGTNLRGVHMSGGYFEAANFAGADLSLATLEGRFHGAIFDGANVSGALMLGAAGLEPEDLRARGAIVTGEDFAEAMRSGRDFSGANLRSAQLQDVNLDSAKLRKADLHSARIDRTHLRGADLRDARLYFASAVKAVLEDADLSGMQSTHLHCSGANFDGAKLSGARLTGADLTGANLRHADLTGADLSLADLTGADLTGAILNGVKVDAAILKDLKGVDAETARVLRKRAGRLAYEVRESVGRFLKHSSLPLHLVLAPLATALALIGFRKGSSQTTYGTLGVINVSAAIPFALGLLFALSGGSPTVQMSDPSLWRLWFHLWPVMVLVLGMLLIGSLIIGGRLLIRTLSTRPHPRLSLAISSVLTTVGNCLFAGLTLLMLAPSA